MMTDLQQLSSVIGNLRDDELNIVEELIVARRQQLSTKDKMVGDNVEQWMDELHRVVTELRQGLSQEELGTIIDAMNEEYVKPEPAIIVTSDNDFDTLPIKRENWR